MALEVRLPFVRRVNWTVDLPDKLAARIRQLAGESADGRETGGILLGHGPDADGVIRVRHVGDAGSTAERRPDFFLRDLRHSRELAARAWLADGSEWVGEWHTHPAGGAEPSTRDLHTYAAILAGVPSFQVLLSIIVTPDQGSWTKARLTKWLIGRRERSAPPSDG
jgi:integrative and conjugative element protein (TIGR02256 family)